MSLFTVDSNNVFGKYVEEAGTYDVIITNARLYTSNNGNKVISIDYQVLDGKYTGCPIIYADSLTWVDYPEENLTMSIKRFNSLLVACGVKDGVAIDSLEQLASALKGQKLAIEVEWKESSKDGKYYLRVLNHQKLLQDGSRPNGKTRPESSQNERQSNFGNNRNQSPDIASKPHRLKIADLIAKQVSTRLCLLMVRHNSYKHQMQMNCHFN